eukprot:4328276-Amphidinium_carterae.1
MLTESLRSSASQPRRRRIMTAPRLAARSNLRFAGQGGWHGDVSPPLAINMAPRFPVPPSAQGAESPKDGKLSQHTVMIVLMDVAERLRCL